MSKIDPFVAKKRVQRAKSAVGLGIKYKLGKGGWHPKAPSPDAITLSNYGLQCDCSGFVAWVLMMRRDQINAKKWWSKLLPWIETTMVYKDATGPQRVFVRLKEPEPGCLVVYGDSGKSQGHIAVVTEVELFYGDAINLHGGKRIRSIKVVDCSSGMSRSTGEAIRERNGDFFLKNGAIFCCLKQDLK
jgi:hypothetical protein